MTAAPLDVRIDVSAPLLIVAGFLVGFGTRLGGGCTSGHGVCGIARFSARSIVATLVFIGVAMVTTFVLRHLLSCLIAGAALFGIGWGIAGFCPGPAITALATARLDVALLVAAMIAGAVAHKILFSSRQPKSEGAPIRKAAAE